MEKAGSRITTCIIIIFVFIVMFYNCPTNKCSDIDSVDSDSYRRIRHNMLNITDLQWKAYKETLICKTLSGQGWVVDVDTQFSGGYKVLLDMDLPGSFSVQDIYIEDVPKNLAFGLRKGQKVYFSGRITSVLNVLGSCAITINYETIN